MAVIQARGLGKQYKGKTAVSNLSFDVRPGTVTGFLGPNGSGKSTTMRLMLGLDRGEGTCLFDGQDFVTLAEPMRHVGALLEAKPFHPRSEEHTSELQSLMSISYAVFCLKKKTLTKTKNA